MGVNNMKIEQVGKGKDNYQDVKSDYLKNLILKESKNKMSQTLNCMDIMGHFFNYKLFADTSGYHKNEVYVESRSSGFLNFCAL